MNLTFEQRKEKLGLSDEDLKELDQYASEGHSLDDVADFLIKKLIASKSLFTFISEVNRRNPELCPDMPASIEMVLRNCAKKERLNDF